MGWNNFTLSNDTSIPSVAYGTGRLGKGDHVVDEISQALSVGFIHIDTAQRYRNEEEVGQAIQKSSLSRSEIYITTKYSGDGGITEAINDSLKKLGISHVDLYLIHSPTFVTDIQTAWKEMEAIQKQGLAKSIGVSNFNVERLQTLLDSATIKPAVNQIAFHPGVLKTQLPIHDFGVNNGILTEGYSPLAPIRELQDGPIDKAVTSIATRLNATNSQVLLAWAKYKGVLTITYAFRFLRQRRVEA